MPTSLDHRHFALIHSVYEGLKMFFDHIRHIFTNPHPNLLIEPLSIIQKVLHEM